MAAPSIENNIYRQSAIENLNSLDEIQSALKIVNTGTWMWLLAFSLTLLGIFLWGVFGTITLSITSQGMIMTHKTLAEAEAVINQSLLDRNEKVAVMADLLQKKERLYKKHYLTLIELVKARDDYIAAKEALSNPNKNIYSDTTRLLKKSNSSNTTLEALIFINHLQGKLLTVGMNVHILPQAFSSYDYGYIKGKVIGISEYPVSKQVAYAYLGNSNLVDDFFVGGAPFIATIRLQKDKNTKSGFAWTSKLGSPFAIHAGTMVSSKIIYKKCSPVTFLFKYGDCQ